MANYLANVGNNRRLYRQAYMLEFVGEDGKTPEDVFTFSLPPKNEELTYPQKKAETPTFGGLHVDEYGTGAVRIILSGTTVNQELKYIYRGSQSPKWLSGEDEIYFLRDLILKHRALDRLVGEKNYKRKVILYDLSKSNGKAQGGDLIKNYWQVFPGEFKIIRSDDRPFTYKYNFEFTGVALEEGKIFGFSDDDKYEPQMTQEMLDRMNRILVGPEDIPYVEPNFADDIKSPENLELVPINVPYYNQGTGEWEIPPDFEGDDPIHTGLFINEGITWEDQGTWIAKIEEAGEIVNEINTEIEVKKGILDTIRGAVRVIEGGLMKAIHFIDGVNGKINDVFDTVKQVSNLLKLAGSIFTYAADTITGTIDSAGNAVVGLMDGATSVIEGATSIISLPKSVQQSVFNAGLEIQNAAERLVNATDELTSTCRDYFSQGGDSPSGGGSPPPSLGPPGGGLPDGAYTIGSSYSIVPKEDLDEYGMSDEEFIDSVYLKLHELECIANELAAAAKSSDMPEVMIGNPDPVTGEPTIVLAYGHTDITIKETDTFESLAAEYFGDPDKAIDIATYNGVPLLDDLDAGAIIRIPVTERTENMKNNRIYARYGERDNYGKDILITDEGNFVLSSSGDYELIDHVENLSQAISLRLKESVVKRMRLIAYGIRTNISDPTAGKAFIMASIYMTVIADPRVASIERIYFHTHGDQLHVDVFYTDINRASNSISRGV